MNLLITLAWLATLAQAPLPEPAIYELVAPPDIDGGLTDWDGVPHFPIPIRHGDAEPGGLAARARLGFDDKFLYLALEVPDDTLIFPERSWRFGDGFYLTVLMPGGGTASSSHISFGFSRVGDRLERVVVNRSGEYFPAVDLSDVRFAMNPSPADLPAPGAGPVLWDDDVVYEIAVPWSILAPANPLTDDSVTLNIVTVGSNGGPDRRFGMLAQDPDFDTERTPVRRGRTLPLRRMAAPAREEPHPALRTGDEAAMAIRLERPVLLVDDTTRVLLACRPLAADPGPIPVRLELVQDSRTVATADHVLGAAGDHVDGGVQQDGPGKIRRARVRLHPGGAARTGPATLTATAAAGGPRAEVNVFLVDRDGLLALARELEAMEADPSVPSRLRASVPSPLLRLMEVLEFADQAPANAPLARPAEWTAELTALAHGFRQGRAAVPRTPGLHRVAHRSALDGTIQPYTVHLPDGYRPDQPDGYPVLVALHGSGVDERGTARSAGSAAAEEDWIVVAPRGRGLSDWYVGDAETDLMEALDHAALTLPVDRDRSYVAGFSMGGYGAWRLALRQGQRFRAAAVLAGAPCPPEDRGGECIADLLASVDDTAVPPILVVHGSLDRAVPVADVRALVERARSVTAVDYREFPDAGHGDVHWWSLAVRWLADRP